MLNRLLYICNTSWEQAIEIRKSAPGQLAALGLDAAAYQRDALERIVCLPQPAQLQRPGPAELVCQLMAGSAKYAESRGRAVLGRLPFSGDEVGVGTGVKGWRVTGLKHLTISALPRLARFLFCLVPCRSTACCSCYLAVATWMGFSSLQG